MLLIFWVASSLSQTRRVEVALLVQRDVCFTSFLIFQARYFVFAYFSGGSIEEKYRKNIMLKIMRLVANNIPFLHGGVAKLKTGYLGAKGSLAPCT